MLIKLDKFILFGDSITRRSFTQEFGFNVAPALADDYSCKLDVVVRGFGGYNTDMARVLIQPILEQETAGGHQIKLMTIFFGTNDAASGNSHVPLDRYTENMRFIVKQAIKKGVKVVIVGTALHEELGPDSKASSATNRIYNEAAKKVADEFGLPFADLWMAFAQAVGWKEGDPLPGDYNETGPKLGELMIDGIHFNNQGYRLYYREVKKAIEQGYPELDSRKLPMLFPPWQDIDMSDVENSLQNWRL